MPLAHFITSLSLEYLKESNSLLLARFSRIRQGWKNYCLAASSKQWVCRHIAIYKLCVSWDYWEVNQFKLRLESLLVTLWFQQKRLNRREKELRDRDLEDYNRYSYLGRRRYYSRREVELWRVEEVRLLLTRFYSSLHLVGADWVYVENNNFALGHFKRINQWEMLRRQSNVTKLWEDCSNTRMSCRYFKHSIKKHSIKEHSIKASELRKSLLISAECIINVLSGISQAIKMWSRSSEMV